MRILYGMLRPDSGEICINERKVYIRDPSVAIRLGIGMVHQHFMLIPRFTVAENIILGHEPIKGIQLDFQRAREIVFELSNKYKMKVHPDMRVEELSVGLAQRVEIMKLLYRGSEILILDEPTAVLTPQEIDELFNILCAMKAQGKTIILITHKLDEVMRISDYITVMRKGEVVGTVRREDINKEELAYMMVGRQVLLSVEKEETNPGGSILELFDVYASSSTHQGSLKGVSLVVNTGEIHGIVGVDGNGQKELVEVITGLRKVRSGDIIFRGISIANRNPKELIKRGISHIPEDRQKSGLILEFTALENFILGIHDEKPICVSGIINTKYIRKEVERIMYGFDIRPQAPDLPLKAFSGGNQQRVVLARELYKRPQLIVAAHPTRGLDIGGIEFIHKKLIESALHGAGILLVSADLTEILSLSDRISVIYDGRIVGTFRKDELDEYQLGVLMLGGKKE